ncbi:MAG: type VI secretion system membrane subunit TssM [Rhodoferax sp.]|nr:type VI secretion system membrane subunit TssM [Rhodoferax sp.]
MFSSISSFLRRFINRTTLAILLLLVLSLVIWYIGPLFAMSLANAQWQPLGPEWVRWCVIAAVWLLWLLKRLIRWWRQRNINGALLGQLAKMQAATPAEGQTAGAQEVAELNKRFKDAADILKKTRFSSNEKSGLLAGLSKQYVYQLPWYAFIGAPGSGKTTALVNAGLTFPLAEQFGKAAIRGIGGTRNCDWWFTNEAVLIDTAGRYTTQESNQSIDKAEWQGFMDLLKRFRPRQPLNGVLLTLSVSDLLQMTTQEREVHAATLKARLSELRDGLGVQFPVYVLVTKTDLLSGFQEYFLNLNREDRAQVWGFTLPYDPKAAPTAVREVFNAEFDLLYRRLNDGMHERLLAEPDLSRRALSYTLPQQLAGLRDVLGRLLASVFSESKFNEQPLLRGVYFTSGTQEGTPFDRVLGAMQRTFRVPAKLTSGEAPTGTGKSFFLQDLLQKVVFPEHFIAGRNLSAENRMRWLRRGGMAACGLLFIWANVAWSPWVSYGNNVDYIAEVAGKAEGLRTNVEAVPAESNQDAVALLPLLSQAREVAVSNKFDIRQVPWSYRYGLYQGHKLDAAGRIAYTRLLDEAFLPRIATRLEALLKNAPPGNTDYLYQALKAYLMLSGAGRFDAEALKLWIHSDWEQSGVTTTVEQRKQLDAHLDALMRDRVVISPFPLNQELIRNAREILNQQPPANRTYSRIRARLLGPEPAEFTIANEAGVEAPNVLVRASKQPLNVGIPGLFTLKGYPLFQKEVATALADIGLEDAWVLGRASPTAAQMIPNPGEVMQQSQQITRLYLTEYAKMWQDYLGDVRLIPRNDLAETIQVVRTLAGADSPLLLLTRAAARETTLIRPEAGATTRVDQALERLDRLKQEVTRAASLGIGGPSGSTGLDNRIEMIVQGPFAQLHAITKGPPGTAPVDLLSKVLDDFQASLVAADSALRSGAIPRTQDAENRLRSAVARMPPPVRPVLEALLAQASQQVAGGARSGASANVKGGVGQTCAAVIGKRYPFSRSAQQDVQANDFAQVFSPGGLMDETFQKNLAAFVDTSKATWAPRPGPEGAAAGSAADLAQFQRASIIRDAFFAPGSRTMKFDLIIRFSQTGGADKLELDIDGQSVVASPGNDGSKRISWPGVRGTNQVRLLVGGKPTPALATEGAWALHRLIDRGQVQGGTPPERLLVNFVVEGRTVSIEFTAQSVRNPLRLPQLEGFGCPGLN